MVSPMQGSIGGGTANTRGHSFRSFRALEKRKKRKGQAVFGK
jgi:hypothetical protein